MQKPVRVRILDQEYLIKSEEDEKEHVQQVARFVNDRFSSIKQASEGLSQRKVAILAAFDIASEYLKQVRSRKEFVSDIKKRSEALNCKIDSYLE